jgi:HK97 family phage major capsid protein
VTFSVTLSNIDQIKRLPLERAKAALAERQEWLATVLREAGPELDAAQVRSVPVQLDDGQDLSGLVRRVSEELDALVDRVDELAKLDRVLARAAEATKAIAPQPSERDPDTIGWVVAKAVREMGDGRRSTVIDMPQERVVRLALGKATMTTTSGFPPETMRTGTIVWTPTEPIQIADLLPTVPTNQSAVVYMEETTFTNAAAERAEAAAYAEASLAYTERSVTVRSIGVSIPVTDEQMDDVPQLAGILDQRLREMLRLRLDTQILAGDGTAPNLLGTLNVSGVLTQAKGADTALDAIYKGIVAIRTSGKAEPSVLIIHPSDFQDIRLAKTTDGVYLFGPPSDSAPARVWGVPVVQSTVLTAGTAVLGDYQRHAALYVRRGIEVEVGMSADDFTRGKKTVRAGLRAAVVHYRPSAFCLVTGI